jgi:hypothetical protein
MKRELTGTYEVPGLGELRILQHEGTLVLDGLIFSKERLYVSDNDLLFSLSGQDIGLERAQDGSVTALVSELIVAKKTK